MDDIKTLYARELGSLKELAFQDEVCTALQQALTAFQRVPTRPNGDGGIDGISHRFERVYCCYGPDLQPTPRNQAKELTKKIVTKFSSDLERILELSSTKNGLILKENPELDSIFTSCNYKKIKEIICVTNCFNDNTIIGSLSSHFNKLLSSSRKKFVADDCSLVIWGPVDVAQNTAITRTSLLRVERPALFATIDAICNGSPTTVLDSSQRSDFDAKFDYLIQKCPEFEDLINDVRQDNAEAWARSVDLNQKLAADFPDLHARFEQARSSFSKKIRLHRLNGDLSAFDILQKSNTLLQESLKEVVDGGIPTTRLESLASHETGHLLGICPIDWRPSGKK